MYAQPKNILFPIDFSRHYEGLLNYAYEFTKSIDGRLFILYNIDPLLRLFEFRSLGYLDFDEETVYLRLYEKYYGELKEITKKLTGVEAQAFIEKGVTYKNIIAAAKKHDIDLVLMGSHGEKSVDYTEMGANVRKVVSFAPCPVLVVKPKGFKTQE